MNKQTLKALKGSIKKWELIVAGKGMDHGGDNCALCSRFYNRSSKVLVRCAGCPVSDYTGETDCRSTAYIDWREAHLGNFDSWVPYPLVANTPQSKKAARAELRFLKSLLP